MKSVLHDPSLTVSLCESKHPSTKKKPNTRDRHSHHRFCFSDYECPVITTTNGIRKMIRVRSVPGIPMSPLQLYAN